MSADLKKVFSPEVLAALDERMRKIAEETRSESASEWLDFRGVMDYVSCTESHAREIMNGLKRSNPDDVYQPNGPGSKPLLVRRSCLRYLTKINGKK